jgi:hypothetical protein
VRVYHLETKAELAWYFACVECGANDRTQLPVVKKFQRPEAPQILSAERHNVIGKDWFCTADESPVAIVMFSGSLRLVR